MQLKNGHAGSLFLGDINVLTTNTRWNYMTLFSQSSPEEQNQ
jgi:hypothetical protein